jgi:hypothetical protein
VVGLYAEKVGDIDLASVERGDGDNTKCKFSAFENCAVESGCEVDLVKALILLE